MSHDGLCEENSQILCVCELIENVRSEERASMEGVSSLTVGALAYARGREEASNAVKRYKVSSIPMFDGDTPASLAERVKGLLGNAALCGEGKEKLDQKTLHDVFQENE